LADETGNIRSFDLRELGGKVPDEIRELPASTKAPKVQTAGSSIHSRPRSLTMLVDPVHQLIARSASRFHSMTVNTYIPLHKQLFRRRRAREQKTFGIKDLRVVAGAGFEPAAFRL
jgi:hypothetical protein